VTQSYQFELVINAKMAKVLSLNNRPTLLAIIDEVNRMSADFAALR